MNYLSGIEQSQVLMHCVSSRQQINITKNWRTTKTAFIGSCKTGITIEGSPSKKSEVGVNFRQGNHKLLFHTTLQGNSLIWPDKTMKIPSRAYKRRRTRETILVEFCLSEHRKFSGRLEDISTGGMKIISINQNYESGTYLCLIHHKKGISTVAVLRQVEFLKNGKSLSFQFVGLEFSPRTVSSLIKLTASA